MATDLIIIRITGNKKQNYLFVCLANENRSPTAEAVCRRIAEENNLEVNAVSAARTCGNASAGAADALFRVTFATTKKALYDASTNFTIANLYDSLYSYCQKSDDYQWWWREKCYKVSIKPRSIQEKRKEYQK